jgi:hypothetical protein
VSAKERLVAALAYVQKEFGLIDLGGVYYILDRKQIYDVLNGDGDKEINYYKRSEGFLRIEMFLENSDIALTNKDVKKLLQIFLRDPSTLKYDSVAFHPSPQPRNVLNFWRPHAVIPESGNWADGPIADLLMDVICAGNKTNYFWLLKFLAHMLQKPDEKPTVAIILLGGQGTGKGMFYRLLKEVWPYTMLQVHDIDDVVGKFTAALERNYGVWMDEAMFTHDNKSMEKLKAVISEHQIRIEEKYQPKRTIDSFHRIFAASNNDHFANIGSDDRRFFILKVSGSHAQDTSYFGRYIEALNDGVSLPAFVDHLLEADISDFNVHLRPKTTEHGEQKLKSLTGINRFFHNVLREGEIRKYEIYGNNTIVWNGSMTIPTEDLMKAYKAFDKNAERHRPLDTREELQKIKRIFPTVEKTRRQEGGRQFRGLEFPSLEDARKEFVNFIGCPIDWDE